jgi:hypothetical protein
MMEDKGSSFGITNQVPMMEDKGSSFGITNQVPMMEAKKPLFSNLELIGLRQRPSRMHGIHISSQRSSPYHNFHVDSKGLGHYPYQRQIVHANGDQSASVLQSEPSGKGGKANGQGLQ